MSWIKRNLYFLIGSLIAVGLMVAGAIFLYSKYSSATSITEEIHKQYSELNELNKQNPHPGEAKAGKIDNVKTAKDQEETLRAYITKSRQYFQKVPAIPDTPKVANADFAAQLRNTMVLLHREAEQSSVKLPNDYYFSFEAQRRLMLFDAGSLEHLATHLGEVKALTEILFNAKINSLDSVRRERVSAKDDTNDPDYLTKKTTSTPLADLTPYEFTFRCFTPELAQVLSALASSPNGFIVKSINVEPAAVVTEAMPGGALPATPAAPVVAPAYAPPAAYNSADAAAAMARRYGLAPGGPQPYFPPATAVPAPVVAAPSNKGNGLTTFLSEKPLKITLAVEVIKLKPATK
jgi:hypothetical protein